MIILNWIRHCCDGRNFYTAHYWEISKKGAYKIYLIKWEE